jgi:hypothetical protein
MGKENNDGWIKKTQKAAKGNVELASDFWLMIAD